MMRSLILVVTSFLLMSCTAIERQFIDVEDTLLIKSGMTKTNTLEIIGKPTEVVRGILMADGVQYEIWRYVTKEGMNETVSQLLPRKPDKNMEIDNWDSPKDFYILFKNNSLVRWGDFTYNWCNGDCGITEQTNNCEQKSLCLNLSECDNKCEE